MAKGRNIPPLVRHAEEIAARRWNNPNTWLSPSIVAMLEIQDDSDAVVGTRRRIKITGYDSLTDEPGNDRVVLALGASASDEKVKVSSDDTTADYLLNKMAAGAGITLTETTPGGDEDVTVAIDEANIPYTPAVLTDWDGDANPGDVDDALDQLAERVDDLEGAGSGEVNTGSDLGGTAGTFKQKTGVDLEFRGISALTGITVTENATDIDIGIDDANIVYTPAVLADWDSSLDPGDVDDALDQLAERVKDLEAGTGLYSVHQYVWGNDDGADTDVATGELLTKHVSGGNSETITRIVVHAETTPASGNLVFTIDENDDEDLATPSWSTVKTVTFTATGADPDSQIDSSPSASFNSRRALRINITTAPAGWQDITIIVEVKRQLTT